MDTQGEQSTEVAEAVLQIFTVFKLFGFKAGDDLRLGSLMQMFEEEGASRSDVDKALAFLLKRGVLLPNSSPGARPGGHMLSAEGAETMQKILGGNP